MWFILSELGHYLIHLRAIFMSFLWNVCTSPFPIFLLYFYSFAPQFLRDSLCIRYISPLQYNLLWIFSPSSSVIFWFYFFMQSNISILLPLDLIVEKDLSYTKFKEEFTPFYLLVLGWYYYYYYFYLQSPYPFGICFVCGVKYKSNFIFSQMAMQCSQHHLLKSPFWSTDLRCHVCHLLNFPYVWV